MSDNIVNRVAKSNLKTIDLEELYPEGERKVLDIKDWLFEELILKEKDFRQYVEQHDWTQYKNAFVAVICSVDAIVSFLGLYASSIFFIGTCTQGGYWQLRNTGNCTLSRIIRTAGLFRIYRCPSDYKRLCQQAHSIGSLLIVN